jgi:hypothetical protein
MVICASLCKSHDALKKSSRETNTPAAMADAVLNIPLGESVVVPQATGDEPEDNKPTKDGARLEDGALLEDTALSEDTAPVQEGIPSRDAPLGEQDDTSTVQIVEDTTTATNLTEDDAEAQTVYIGTR